MIPGKRGYIYALDGKGGAIIRIDPGGLARVFKVPEARSADATGITLSMVPGREAILIAVGQRGAVLEVPLDAQGDPVCDQVRWAVTGLHRPTDVAVAPDGTVWATEPDRHRIVGVRPGDKRPSLSIDLNGQLLSPWSASIVSRQAGEYTIAVADAGAGKVFLAEIPLLTGGHEPSNN